MILISHRGNTEGKTSEENNPSLIDRVINEGFDVEIDVWVEDSRIFLGHDNPEYEVSQEWLLERTEKLWIHCKNVEALNYFSFKMQDFNFFWHDTDVATLTSKGFLWVYPGKQPVNNSIAVMPEIYSDDLSRCVGICSDFIKNYENLR